MVIHDIEFCAKYANRYTLFLDGSIVTEDVPRTFSSGNSFYTTAVNLMTRKLLPGTVTVEAVIAACSGVMNAASALTWEQALNWKLLLS